MQKDYIKNSNYFVPFWMINDDISEETIYKKIKKYSDAGFKALMPWFSLGLEVEFLSEEFIKRMKKLVAIAKRLKTKIWIYDDYNWPSGTSAGKIVQQFPQYREKFLEYLIFNASDTNDFYTPNKIVSSFVVKKGKEVIYLKDHFKANYLDYKIKEGEKVIVFYEDFFEGNLYSSRCAKWINNSPFYLDLLNKESVNKFIEFNLETFKSAFGDEFGKTIVGVFTDEPAILMRWPGYTFYVPEGFSYPWSNVFEQAFLNLKGYGLRENLYKLIVDSEDSYQFRVDYFEVVSDLYENAFNKNIADWCHKNNLLFTGHLLFEEEIPHFTSCETNYYKNVRSWDIPGIDTLHEHNDIKMVKRDITPKFASSVRNMEKLKFAMSEVFAVSTWGVNFEVMKNILGRLSNFGINFFVPSSVGNTLKGFRKKASPVFDYQPYWKFMGEYIDYFSMVSYLLENSQDISEIGLLYPTENLWANFNADPSMRSKSWKDLQRFIEEITNNLVRSQTNFNYVFEEISEEKNLFKKGGRIYFRNIEVKTLIIPPINYLSDKLEKFLNKFLDFGGSIINTSSHLAESPFGKNKNVLNIKYDSNFISRLLNSNDIKNCVQYKLEGIAKNYIYSSIRKFNEETDILILHNQSYDREFKGKLIIRDNESHITGLDIVNSEYKVFFVVTDYTRRPNENKNFINDLSVQIYLRQNDLVILFIRKNGCDCKDLKEKLGLSESKIDEPTRRIFKNYINIHSDNLMFDLKMNKKNKDYKLKLKNENTWKFEVPYNIYAISKVRIKQDRDYSGKKLGYYKPDFNDSEWKVIKIANLDDYDHLSNQEDLYGLTTPEEIRENSVNFWIRGQFNIDQIPNEVYMAYEDSTDFYEIYLNGIIVNDKREKFFIWDDTNKRIDIKRYLKKGENSISLVTRTPNWTSFYPFEHFVEPIVLIGSFSVIKDRIKKASSEIKLGSWVDQGYPNFTGTAVYRNEIDVGKKVMDQINKGEKVFMRIDELKEVVEVFINGKRLGRKIFAPYIFEISKFLSLGNNIIELKVSNTMSNLFTKIIDSGIIGEVNIMIV